MRLSIASLALAALLAVSRAAAAFCGFYVSGADAKMFNNATMVVRMREGTRTVLSMQNNYRERERERVGGLQLTPNRPAT